MWGSGDDGSDSESNHDIEAMTRSRMEDSRVPPVLLNYRGLQQPHSQVQPSSSEGIHHSDDGVITIDSDDEEDTRIRNENRLERLIPDGRIGRPRDMMNRFVNTNGSNRAIEDQEDFGINLDNDEDSHNNTRTNNHNDDLEIISAIDRPHYDDGPIYPESEYIDLDNEEQTVVTPARSIQRPVMIVDHASSTNNNPNNDNNNDNDEGGNGDDDGIAIVEERTTRPTVLLNLPGGEQLRIDATNRDAPMRSSFEWAVQLPESRHRLLRRSGRRVGNMIRNLFEPEDSDDNYNNSNNEDANEREVRTRLPAGVMAVRRRQIATMREIERRRRERLQNGTNSSVEGVSSGNPLLDQIRHDIQTYPPDVRSAFDHAQSLHEFRLILQRVAPVTLEECGSTLTNLYTEYRSHVMENWATSRVQAATEEARRNRERHPNGGSRRGGRSRNSRGVLNGRRQQWNRFRSDGTTSDNDDDYDGYAIWRREQDEMLRAHGFYTTDDDEEEQDSRFGFGPDAERREQERTQNIINMIQAREERERDSRVKTFMQKTKQTENKFKDTASKLPEGYSSNFDSTPKMKMTIVKKGNVESVVVDDDMTLDTEMDVPSCTLCGIELGVGIPDSFQGLFAEDQGVSFEYLVEEYGYSCPYQSLLKPTQLDRDLSRRTYVAGCGHTYCGRCYVRIENAKSKSKLSKKKLAALKGSSHPDNYGPRNCPAKDCGGFIRARGKMREMYL